MVVVVAGGSGKLNTISAFTSMQRRLFVITFPVSLQRTVNATCVQVLGVGGVVPLLAGRRKGRKI